MTSVDLKVVLVVDDDATACMIAEAALSGAGYSVVTASDGAGALEVYAAAAPDCIVLDVMMPRMNGYEACAAIRALPGGDSVPILMLTARDDAETIAAAYAAGATDFAQKGINPRLLAERVRFLLRASALQRGLAASEARLAHAQRMARLGHWELTLDGDVVSRSPVLPEILGLPEAALEHRDTLLAALPERDAHSFAAGLEDCWRFGTPLELDLALAGDADRASEATRLLYVEGQLTQRGPSARDLTLTLTFQDVTRLRRAEEEARILAYYDTATRLPNRRYAHDHLRRCLRVADGHGRVGVLVLRVADVDRVIQSLGSRPAEELLRRCASRLEEAISADGAVARGTPGTAAPFVAHLGSGEFVVVLPDCESGDVAQATAAALVASITKPVRLEGESHVPSAHVGIALGPDDSPDADALLERARGALRQAEATEPGCSSFYSPELQSRSRQRISLEASLRNALAQGELRLVYQPRVDLQSLQVVGCEALLRWLSPRHGEVPPQEFIPIAEETGQIWELGTWVLERALRQSADWRKRYARQVTMAVNVSPRQISHPLLARTVETALVDARLPATCLELEITESCMIEAGGVARRVLERLRADGVHVAIDDFGTGYSSLGHLSQLPIDSIKIDQSFAAGLPHDAAARGVVSAVLAMARSLRARTIAEGIENEGQLTMLLALGCDEGQGYLFAKPLEADDFEIVLANGYVSRYRDARDRAFA